MEWRGWRDEEKLIMSKSLLFWPKEDDFKLNYAFLSNNLAVSVSGVV